VQDIEYSAVVHRVRNLCLVLIALGTIAFAFQSGRNALSFLGGSAIASLSFYLLHRLVSDLGAALAGKKPRGASFVLHALRLIVLGAAAFAIVKVYGASVSALAVGLIVPVTAIVLEALYELTYARD